MNETQKKQLLLYVTSQGKAISVQSLMAILENMTALDLFNILEPSQVDDLFVTIRMKFRAKGVTHGASLGV